MSSWRKKLAVGGTVAAITGAATMGWAYLDAGATTTDVHVNNTPPYTETESLGNLVPDLASPILVRIYNPLDHAIIATTLGTGTSRGYTTGVNNATFDCPAGSVTTASRNEPGGMTQVDDPDTAGVVEAGTTIPASGSAVFEVWATFDVTGFARYDGTGALLPANDQDGCLGQNLTIDFASLLTQPTA